MARPGQATRASCFVLHRAGFVMPPCFRAGRWALTPPFHPYFSPHGSKRTFVRARDDEAVYFL
jgi:hypothetical protein